MPAPSSYTESSLKTFMVGVLDSVATDLGLTTASTSIGNAVTAVERLLDVSDVAALTDMSVLEAAATWKSWEVALGVATTKYDLKAGTADLKRSQMFASLNEKVSDAETAYYAAVSASDAASGSGIGFFFGIACGARGR
jgi:hypothetical protein